MESVSVQETANKKNLVLLVTLRWLAVGGQIVTIIVVQGWLGIKLPLMQMGCVILFLVALNLVSVLRCRSDAVITSAEIFFELLLDVAALTAQLTEVTIHQSLSPHPNIVTLPPMSWYHVRTLAHHRDVVCLTEQNA